MEPKKKVQHYVPQFYLRNFSYEENKKQIGLFNVHNKVFCSTAPIKSQAARDYFYGKDGVIENRFSAVEGSFSEIISDIIKHRRLPAKGSRDHYYLRGFVGTTDLRGPTEIDFLKETPSTISNLLRENGDVANFEIPEISHEDAIDIVLKSMKIVVDTIADLKFKLLINNTNTPFICSDYPFVRYNSFLEQKKWPLSRIGFGLTGLKIFMPVSPELLVVFYDTDIYKVGVKKGFTCEVTSTADVDQINLLQILNCSQNVFFNHKVSKQYIEGLYKRSLMFHRSNMNNSYNSHLLHPGESNAAEDLSSRRKDLMILASTESEIKLSLSFLKIHSKGKATSLSSSASQLRAWPTFIFEEFSRKNAFKGFGGFGSKEKE